MLGATYTFNNAVHQGHEIKRAQTVAVTTMVFIRFLKARNRRSERLSIFQMKPLSNPMLFYSFIAALIMHLLGVYLPALQRVSRTAPLPGDDWVVIGLAPPSVVAVVALEKAFRRRPAPERQDRRECRQLGECAAVVAHG